MHAENQKVLQSMDLLGLVHNKLSYAKHTPVFLRRITMDFLKTSLKVFLKPCIHGSDCFPHMLYDVPATKLKFGRWAE